VTNFKALSQIGAAVRCGGHAGATSRGGRGRWLLLRLARTYDASQKGTGTVSPAPNKRSWFEPLVFATERPALAFAMMLVRDRSTAEEIVQDAFARVWVSPKTPTQEAEFRRWLYRAITNLANDHLRRQARFARLRFWLAAPKNPLDAIDRWVEDDELVQTLRRLSRREQLAVYLFYYEDRPFEDVDRLLGTRPGTARKKVSRALQKLRTQLMVDAVEEPSH
jgi:RNA polymerase sigma factor (sigma-70 family)